MQLRTLCNIYYAPCMNIHRSSIMRKTKFLREVCFMVPFLKIHAEQDAFGPKSLQRSVQELVFWLISH